LKTVIFIPVVSCNAAAAAAAQGLEWVRATPPAFEVLAGGGATRNWRTSITVLPDGPDDAVVPQPLALGELLKQHQLDNSSVALQGQQQQQQQQTQLQQQDTFLGAHPPAAAAAAAAGVADAPS
jgi:hypothetical protein